MPNPAPLSPIRIAEKIRSLSDDSQMITNTIVARLNAIAFERALQAGYIMACEDLGAPLPMFVDPQDILVNQLASKAK